MHASSLCAFVSAHAYLEQNCSFNFAKWSSDSRKLHPRAGKKKQNQKGSNNLEGSILENFLMNRDERKGNEKEGGKREERNRERKRKKERERKAVECRLIDTILGEARNSSRRTIYSRTSETNFHLDPFDGLFPSLPFPWQFRMDGERAKERKRRRRKKEEKGGGCTMAQSQRQKSYRGCRRGN